MEYVLIFGLMFVLICFQTTVIMYQWVRNKELKAANENLKLPF